MKSLAVPALQTGQAALIALTLLQIVWHALLAPPPATELMGPTLIIAIAPLLPGLWIARHSPRKGLLVGGMAGLLYVCHGVAELWDGYAPHALAVAEILLVVAIVATLSWDTYHDRRARTSAAENSAARP